GTHTLMLPGGRTNGLFYQFSKPKAGIAIGVAESYIAAAANYKLNKIPTVCAFSTENISIVKDILQAKYPTHQIVIV
ncbi:MAG: hypothetical protein ABH827_02910, partial [bacterium]